MEVITKVGLKMVNIMAKAFQFAQMAQQTMKASGLTTVSMVKARSIMGLEKLGTMENIVIKRSMDKAHSQKKLEKSLVVYGTWTS